METSLAEVKIEQERRYNRPVLYTGWCGPCRWGTESTAKGKVRSEAESHLVDRHSGEGEIVDLTTRMRSHYRYIEDD